MIVLQGMPGLLPDNNSGTFFVQTETAHTCDTCRKRLKVGSPAYFSWDVLGAYFTHRECPQPKLVSRKPTVIPDPPVIVPVAPKRSRSRPEPGTIKDWDGKVIG
jgi:hypothetical protein